MQPPIWKKNVNVSGFAERNRLAIEDENRRLREAERSEPRSEPMGVPKMKSGIGTVKFDLGGGVWDERDAEELADDPTYGGVAHEALWKRDMKAARDEADAIGLELSNPSAFLTKEQRQKMLDDGILLSEDDPRHKEIKAQLIADEEKRPALEQKQWDAKKRAQDLARMGPKGYQELRQQQKLQGVAQASQSITAQEAEIRAKDAEGVSGRDLEEHQLAKQQILAQKQDIQSQAQSLVVPDKRVTAVTQNGVRTEYDPNTQPLPQSQPKTLAQKLQEANLYGSATLAMNQAADKGIRRKSDGDWDLPAMMQQSDSSVMNSIGGMATLLGQKTGARLDSMGAAVDKKAIQKVFHDFQQENNLSDEEMASAWMDLGNQVRKWDKSEKIRTTSTGDIMFNPTASELLDTKQAHQIIDSAPTSDQQKAAAKQSLAAMQTAVAFDKLGAYESAAYVANNITGVGIASDVTGNGLQTPSEFAKEKGFKNMASPDAILAYEKEVLSQQNPAMKWARGISTDFILGLNKLATTRLGNIAQLFNSETAAGLAAEGSEGGAVVGAGKANTGVVGSVVQEIPSLAEMVVVGRLIGTTAGGLTPKAIASATSQAGTVALAGSQSAGMTYASERAEGATHEEAEDKAWRAGINTAIITGVFQLAGAGSVESFAAGKKTADITLRDIFAKASRDQLATNVRKFAGSVFKGTATEGLEEGLDELSSSFVNADPDASLSDAWDNAVASAGIGALIGGTIDIASSTGLGAKEQVVAKMVAEGQAAPTPEEQRKVDEVAGADADVEQQVQYTKAQREISAADPEAAERATATLKLARGASMDELTANEVRSLGVTRDGAPLSPDVPAMVEIVNGRPIVLDGAIQELEAIAPSAKGLVTMTEGEARSKFSKQPFTVTSKSGAVIQVDAKDPAEAEKIGAQRFDLGDPVETVTLAATGGASVGTAAPPAPTPAGATTAQPVADQTVQKLRTRLGKLVNVTNDPKVRVHALPDLIEINPEALKAEAAASGLDETQTAKWINDIVDEEVRHLAQHSAARDLHKQSGDKRSFEEWRDEHYAMVWNTEFVATGKDAMVKKLYGDTLDNMPEWMRAMEGIRMMWQRKENGNPTELAKLWTKLSDAMVEELKAVLRQLRAMVKNLSPEMKRELALLQSKLKEIENEQNNKVKEAQVPVQPMPAGTAGTPAQGSKPAGTVAASVGGNKTENSPKASKPAAPVGFVVGQEVTGKVTSENDVDHGKTMSGTVFKTGDKYVLVTVPSRTAPVRMAVGDVTTKKGQELSVKQGELAVNEPQATKPKAERKPRKAKALQRHMEIFMQNPVVIALIDSGGVMSKSMAQKVYGKDYVEANKSLWDDMPEMRNPAYSVIWSGENGNRPDQAAATLGYDSSTDLWDALGKVINNSQKQAIQEREADANMSQAEDFARVKDDGPYRVNVDEMSKGDKLVIDGENFTVATVTRKDGEVAKVVLEDGARFGRQTLEGGEEVWVEEFDDGTPEMTAEEAAARDAADQARVPEPEWMPFEKSLGIPRSEMPQIKASDRAAMVQFLKARGIDYREETMPANRLKATQVEYSPEKVRNYEGGDRSILISGDNYVVDGHHQWLAAGDGDIKVIRLLAPIRKVLATVSEMPSVETAKGEKPAPVTTKPAEKVEAESPTIAQLNDPSYFSQRVIQEIDDAIAQYTNNGKRKISDVFGKSEESRRVKMFIERGNAIRSYAINTKASGPEATFRININKATSFAELRDAAVKLHSKLTSAKTPATKMDIAQTNAKQLFDDDGGFALASQTTQDGDAINKAKADAEAAKEAADKAQGKLFDLTENDKAIADAFDGLFAATLSSGQSKDDGAESLRDESAQNLPRTEVTPRNARKITSRSAKELGIAIARGEAKKNRRYLQEGDESVVERYGNDWVFKSIKDKGIYVYTPDGRLTRSKDFRDLELKAEIINFLGGFETVAITDNEGKYLLQKYGKGIVSEEELESATLPFGLKPNEVNHIEHNGQQYAISDLHHKNFRKDGEGNIRVIDLIVGKVPVNVTLSDISDSLLAAPLTDRARSEMDEGAIKETMAQQKEFGNVVKPPNRASMGDERTRQVVDAFDIDFETRREKESRDQWVKQGTKKAATGRKDLIENALMNAYGEVGAVPMMPEDMIGTQIVIEQMVQEAGNNYDKLIEAGTIIQAYRKVRGDIARVLASGWDRLMPPDERNRRYLANAILTLPPTIERDISKRGYSPEKTRELIQSELRTRLTKIEKALKEYGVTINEVLGKQVYLSLNKKNIVKDIMAKNTKDEQLAIRMHQQAYDVQKIAKATHMTVTEVQELIDKVYAEALERMKVKARAGATLESLQAAALSEAEIEAEARRMVEIGLGIAPKAHTTATRMMKRKAVNIPTEPAKVNWARPEFTSGLLEYTFDAKDLDAIKQTVQALVDATAAKAKVESITDPAKRAKADALLAKLETILAKYGTDISAVVESGKPLESYRFDITDRVHVHIVANAIRSVDADWIDKGTEYSYFSMLSGIQTFAKNLSSVPWTAFEATAQRGSEAVMNWFFKNPMNATFGEVEYMAKAMQPMLHRAQSNFMASLGAEAPFFEQDILGVPPDLEKVLEGHGMYHRTAISGRKGRRLRIPTRLLMATDEYVKTINAMVEVGAMAYRLCRAANLTPGTPAFDEKIKELVNTPGSLAWQLAAKKAYQRTFSNSLPGETDPVTGSVRPTRTIGEAIGRGVYAASKIGNSKVDTKMAKLAGALFRIAFFPFIKIPYNITATAFNYTALSVIDIAILTAHYILDKKEGKKLSDQKDIQRHEMELMLKKGEVIERLSKMMIGNVLTGLLLGMGLGEGDDDDLEKGLLITGSRPHKKTKTGAKETSERLGIGAYTISWKRKDGTRGTFNYGAIEPLATILATNIDTINQLKQAHRGKQTYGEAIGGISYSFINQLSDKTFLKGFGQLWKMLEGEVDMSQFAADKIGMIMPNLIKQIVRESDPVVRDKAESFSQEVAYAIMPIGQKKAKVDIYGQEVKKRGTAFSRWIDFTESGSVEYRQLDEMMWKAQQKFPKLTLPSSAQATYTVDGQQKTMTANQADMYRKWAGDYFTKRLSTLNLNYENPSDRDVAKIMGIVSESRRLAKKALMKNPNWK